MDPLRICFITAEIHPFSKTGGLADVSAALPRFLAKEGHDIRVFTPLYSKIDKASHEFQRVEFLTNIPLRIGGTTVTFSVFRSTLPASDLGIYFIDCAPLYQRPGIYTDAPDEPVRFAMLSRAAIECCQRMGWAPEILHCHDWHASLTPLYLRTIYAWDSLFKRSKTLLTIHNIGYQGIFSVDSLPLLGLSDSSQLFYKEDLEAGGINFLKTGILYASVLTAVSRTYAREIQTEELGAGLHELLRARRDHLFGIVNGIDEDEWNPATDPHIPARYSVNSLPSKGKNKKALLEQLGLSYSAEVPAIGFISRLTVQKGIDLFFDSLPGLLSQRDVRLAVLGSGETRYEQFFSALQSGFPGKVCFYRGFSAELAHLIEAGSDMFLMPSLYEPCGLNQMYSLKYGTVPIVRKTGGLADTVEPYDPSTGEGTGFVFEHYTSQGLRWAVDLALRVYHDRKAWKRIMVSGMSRDFSWDAAGRQYVSLYSRLAGR